MRHQILPRELQMEITDCMACPGTCPGCFVQASERRVATFYEPDQHQVTRIIEQLAQHGRQRAARGDLRSAVIIFGYGDHLLFSDDYLRFIYLQAAAALRHIEPLQSQQRGVVMSFALIADLRRLADRMRALKSVEAEDVPLNPNLVFDPTKINTAIHHEYVRAFALVSEIFGHADISINLSRAACQAITPVQFFDFLAQAQVRCINLNWQPSLANQRATLGEGDNALVADWICQSIDLALEQGVEIGNLYTIRRMFEEQVAFAADHGPATLGEVLDSYVHDALPYAFRVDVLGNFYPKFDSIGDIAQDENVGLQSLGNVLQDAIDVIVSRSVVRVKSRILRDLQQGACVQCHYRPVCATMGFHVHNRAMRQANPKSIQGRAACPNIAHTLFSHAMSRIAPDLHAHYMHALAPAP